MNMNEINANELRVVEAEFVDEVFGATSLPSLHSPLQALFSQYNSAKQEIKQVAEYVNKCAVFSYFAEGARMVHDRSSIGVAALFDEEAAILALDTRFWSSALALTDVQTHMPAKRRNEWSQMIRTGYSETEDLAETTFGWDKKKKKERIPAFEEDTVKSTLGTMLAMRQQFFAERIDGIWNALSTEHLTNAPQAFGKRMILKRVMNSYDHLEYDMANYIHDLRSVIARYMGRDEPHYTATNSALDGIIHDVVKSNGSGKWHSFDGGAWSIRMYKIGTAHMLIHPDMAWRLNAVLASLHPMAIPSEFRKKPVKKAKEVTLVHNLIPFEVLNELEKAKMSKDCKGFEFYGLQKPMSKSCIDILTYLGGVPSVNNHVWQFEYVVAGVISEVCSSGSLPEERAFQYYPTNETLAQEAVDWADIGETDEICEPSAGQAGIANFLPKERTTCVELSKLHCKVLEGGGFKTVEADFLEWSPGKLFERFVMNPPFAGGRAEAHLRKAASLLTKDGVLVAILPASFKGKTFIEGRTHEYSSVRAGEFKGVSASVVMLKLH